MRFQYVHIYVFIISLSCYKLIEVMGFVSRAVGRGASVSSFTNNNGKWPSTATKATKAAMKYQNITDSLEEILFDPSKQQLYHEEDEHASVPLLRSLITNIPCPSSAPHPSEVNIVRAVDKTLADVKDEELSEFPIAAMMQGSAPYIATHAGQIAVFHIPGDLLLNDKKVPTTTSTRTGETKITTTSYADALLNDIALIWYLGMKVVLVVSGRDFSSLDMNNDGDEETCEIVDDEDIQSKYSHECYNSLREINEKQKKKMEEEAGVIRFEIERKLNKSLKKHSGLSASDEHNVWFDGNVISGHFYTAKSFGMVRDKNFKFTGYTQQVMTTNIKRVLNNNDIVLITDIGSSTDGDVTNVNGNHLAAAVATSLNAHKLIYIANQGSVLKQQEDDPAAIRSKPRWKNMQDIPLSFAKDLVKYYNVKVNKIPGYATFENAKKSLHPSAVELLLHLGWASYAIENGVTRAHIVNPKDGAILEELFTTKNGENTCIYHDEEYFQQQALLDNLNNNNNNNRDDDLFANEDLWDDFFQSQSSLLE